jgi:tetratricopeptide (TPR) repeat protein
MLAEAQKETGKLDEAAYAVQEALGLLSASSPEPHGQAMDRGHLLMLLGQVRLLQGRHIQAAEAFAQAADHVAFRAPASLDAARCYYFAHRYALAMKYIDLADRYSPTDPAVQDWKRKIEDARFGQVASTSAPSNQ